MALEEIKSKIAELLLGVAIGTLRQEEVLALLLKQGDTWFSEAERADAKAEEQALAEDDRMEQDEGFVVYNTEYVQEQVALPYRLAAMAFKLAYELEHMRQ